MSLEIGGLNLWLVSPDDGARIHVLRGLDLSLDRGQSLGLVGESGSGKTMTGLSILRLLPPGAMLTGTIVLNGRSLMDLAPEEIRKTRGKEVAMVFQEPSSALNPLMRVGDQIAETIAEHMKLGSTASAKEAVEWIERVGFRKPDEIARLYPHQLSGGMRQRIVIAQSLCCRPSLMIADEPTTALDVSSQREILDLIRGLRSELGAALIMISHDLAMVANEVEKLAIMYAGKIVEVGAVSALLESPKHPYTGLLLKAIPAWGSKERLAAIGGAPPDFKNISPGCSFAPRCPWKNIRCSEEPSDQGAAENNALCWFPRR